MWKILLSPRLGAPVLWAITAVCASLLCGCPAETPAFVSPAETPTPGPTDSYLIPSFDLAAGINNEGLGRSVTIADLDGDGVLDLLSATSYVASASGSTISAHRGLPGGGYEEVTATWGLQSVDPAWSLLPLDIDLDGDLDIVVTADAWYGPMADRLLINDGLSWTSEPMPAPPCGLSASMSATAADFDGDGDLDVAVAAGTPDTMGGCSALFLNDGGELVAQVEAGSGPNDSFGAASADLDGDGRPELLLSGRFDVKVFPNQGGSQPLDLEAEPVTLIVGGQATLTTVLLDYDQDGDLDVFICSWGDPRIQERTGYQKLYRNDGGLQFSEVGAELGVAAGKGCMGLGTGDLDGNGYPDLYQGTGGPEPGMETDNLLLMNTGEGHFVDATEASGLALPGRSHGIQFVDMDGDARLDLVLNSGGAFVGQEEPLRVLLNRGPSFPTIKISLRGAPKNPYAVGARVSVRTDDGLRYRWNLRGQGFGSSVVAPLQVGLGNASRIEDVIARFPDGVEVSIGPQDLDVGGVEISHPAAG